MEKLHAASIQNTSIFGISLLLIASTRATYHWSGVCLTGDMIGDFMTKPLQGALFCKFRDQIMGVVPAQDPGPGKAITKINELNTHTDKPIKGKELKPSRGKSTIYNLVPSKEKGWHHRSVLGEVTWMKDGCSKNLTRTRNVPPKCNKQVTNKQRTRFSLTSINYSSKTTVTLGTATTILEIGISFPTINILLDVPPLQEIGLDSVQVSLIASNPNVHRGNQGLWTKVWIFCHSP
jgi:hypothetical protein